MCDHTLPKEPALKKAALQALADACNYSLSAHVPVEAVTRKFRTHLRGDVKKALKELRREGYCLEHPTGRNTTWQLTSTGLNMARMNMGM
jgi:hypothetical protein